jgi:L-malate glycosyltransferase
MRVLYANHTSRISGGERALLDLLSSLPAEVEPQVACPPGPLATAVRALNIPVATINEADASFRMHPWRTPRGIAQVLGDGLALRRIARNSKAQLIHANSVRTGLMTAVSTRLGAPPAIVHIHDCLPQSRMAKVVRYVLSASTTALVANSHYTAAKFGWSTDLGVPTTIYNPIDLIRFNPRRINRAVARNQLGLEAGAPVLGVIAQITPWKGQADAIRCAAALRRKWPDLRLLLVGGITFASRATRYDNRAYSRFLRRLTDELRLNDTVQFLGERQDIPVILRALDLLLVPSWEEPFGRVVIEAMAMETPVVATSVGGPAEVITDGTDGLLLPPQRPQEWADAVSGLIEDRPRRLEMGRRARRTVAKSFSREIHVASILAIYQRLLSYHSN